MSRLCKVFNHVISQWVERFGSLYPQLKILERELRGWRTREEVLEELRVESVEQLIEIFTKRNRPLLDEMRRLIELLIPQAGVNQTDEYREIVVGALRERRGGLRECLNDFDQLKLRSVACSLPRAVSDKIDALVDEAAGIESAAIKFGLEDDEFVDADDLEMVSE
jgi:hypothetical protein